MSKAKRIKTRSVNEIIQIALDKKTNFLDLSGYNINRV